MAKPKKLITYVLTVSRQYPASHPRAGQETGFVDAILFGDKEHTCRGNYAFWAKRAAKIQAGEAVLSLRYWSGKPRKSKQVEFAKLYYISVQKVHVYQVKRSRGNDVNTLIFIDNRITPLQWPFKFARRDGLTPADFNAWFKKPVEDAACIHFTDFRY